jgi:membrane-associated phospholipid phosphatase
MSCSPAAARRGDVDKVSLDWFVRWAVIAIMSVACIAWADAQGVTIAFAPILEQLKTAAAGLAIGAALTVLAWRWGRARFVALAVADFSFTLAQLLVYLLPAASLEYLAATIGHPLFDWQLNTADALMGFNWASFAASVPPGTIAGTLLIWAYTSVIWQSGLVMLANSASRPGDTAADFVWTIMLCGLICTVVFAGYPAMGNDGLAERGPIAALLEARSAAWHRLDLDQAQGLVTFPSFHTSLGFIFVYGARRVRWLFWLLIPVNAVMVVSTISIGGHYLIDVIAGAAAAIAAIWLTAVLRGWISRLSAGLWRGDAQAAGKSASPAGDPV